MRLHTDLAVFNYIEDQKLKGIATWHMDDMISTGDAEFYEKIIKPVLDSVTFGSSAEGTYKCLGWNIRHMDGSIRVSKSDYLNAKVDYLNIDTENRKKDDLLNKEKVQRINWLDTNLQLEDILTKRGIVLEPIVKTLNNGSFLQMEETQDRDWIKI